MMKMFPDCINSLEKVFFSLNHNSVPKVLSIEDIRLEFPKLEKAEQFSLSKGLCSFTC